METDLSTSLPHTDGRDKYLRQIEMGSRAPIVLVAGLSGSGKTTLLNFLADMGIESSERLIPRPRRDDDVEGDRPWGRIPDERGRDALSQRGIVWSDHKYTGYIGFRSKPLVDRILKNPDSKGVAVIIGRGTEIAPTVEAFQRILPAQPVVVVRVDAPTAVIASRLAVRPGATPAEREERLAKLEPMNREDAPQIEPLARVWGMTSILNISEDEVKRLGLPAAQVAPATRKNLNMWVCEAIARAQREAAKIAGDMLEPRVVQYGNRFIPDPVLDVLENTLVPAFNNAANGKSAPRWSLKGGLAVAFYLPESRPVSPDIDFAVRSGATAEKFLGNVITSILKEETKFTEASRKAVYHDRKFYGEVMSKNFGQKVELDALTATRIQPDERSFCYKFDLDTYMEFHRRTVKLPKGSTVDLCPPEQIVFEKLIAGRGLELNKFDLFDSAGLMATVPMQPTLFRRIIELQAFDPDIDQAVVSALGASGTVSTEDALGAIGILKDDAVARIAIRKLPQLEVTSELPEMPSSARAFTLTELKRVCMAQRAVASLDQIIASVDTKVQAGEEVTSISERFGREKVLEAVLTLKMQLLHYVDFEVGARDVFVRRDPNQSGPVAKKYFSQLERQRAIFSKRG
jgi:energy-coupling factor transporter ATP-binding protein EcfA2